MWLLLLLLLLGGGCWLLRLTKRVRSESILLNLRRLRRGGLLKSTTASERIESSVETPVLLRRSGRLGSKEILLRLLRWSRRRSWDGGSTKI